MRAEFRSALAAARLHDDPDGRISVIKQAVANEVSSVDPTATPRFTEYFNHSIAPDIVLRWPNEEKERLVYVRPTGNANWLLNEMRFVSPQHPLVFSLEDLDTVSKDGASESAWQTLDNEASATNTWITDSSGTEAMASVRKQSIVLGVLSQALVRGGRGVAGGREVRKLTEDTERGFRGVSRLSVSATRSAVAAIEGHLDEEQSGRLTRLLRALWESHQGDSARFPQTLTVGNLTADDLTYLLATNPEGSADFWRSLGRAIDTELLARTHVEDPSTSLQALILASLDVLQAKGIRLIDEAWRLDEKADTLRWIIARGCLALRGLNWTAYVAAQKKDELPPSAKFPVPDLKTLRARAAGSNVPIIQVQFGRDERAVIYKSKDGRDVLGDPELGPAIKDLRVTDIDEAVAALPSGGNVEIDFSVRSGTGVTSSMFPLGTLMRSVLPLLADFTSEEQSDLRRVLQGEFERSALFEITPAGNEEGPETSAGDSPKED
jgi:hypothetical protein